MEDWLWADEIDLAVALNSLQTKDKSWPAICLLERRRITPGGPLGYYPAWDFLSPFW